MSAATHKPNWLGKPSIEIRADAQAWADQQPVTTTCLFCEWRFVGLVADARDAARTHREQEHPVNVDATPWDECYAEWWHKQRPAALLKIGEKQ